LALRQRDPAGRQRVWPQRFGLRVTTDAGSVVLPVISDAAATTIEGVPDGARAPFLFNADGLGYGLFPADLRNLERWGELSDVQKGVELINIYENVLSGSITAVEVYFLALLDIVETEQNQLVLDLGLSQLSRLFTSLLPDDRRERHTREVEAVLWRAMRAQTDGSRKKIYHDAFAALASTPAEVEKLYSLWSGDLVIEGLKLAEDDFIELAETLAIRLPERSAAVVAAQIERTQNPDSRRRLEFIAPSLSPDEAVRDAFFASLADAGNRETETWVLGALRNLHHPSRVAHSEKYILPSLELLREIQVTGDIFFPTRWLVATLENHRSSRAVETVRAFLAARPDYNAQLRMKILQAADMPMRANRIVATPGS
jgi:aminopeptidase N